MALYSNQAYQELLNPSSKLQLSVLLVWSCWPPLAGAEYSSQIPCSCSEPLARFLRSLPCVEKRNHHLLGTSSNHITLNTQEGLDVGLPVPKVPRVGELRLDQGLFWVEDLEHGDGLDR